MAMAGAERIFKLLDEEPEVDEGYVTLVNAKEQDGTLVPCKERTGMWAWEHQHQNGDETTYVPLKGDVVFDAYAGSFSTAIACYKEKRKFIGCEILPKYFEKAMKRLEWEQRTQYLF